VYCQHTDVQNASFCMAICSPANSCTSSTHGTTIAGLRGQWLCCSCISIAQSGETTSSNRRNASVKIAVGSGLSKLASVVNRTNNGGSQHCNTLGRSKTMGQNGTFTASVQLKECGRCSSLYQAAQDCYCWTACWICFATSSADLSAEIRATLSL